MRKDFVADYDTIIESSYKHGPLPNGVKDGDLIPHKLCVQHVSYYIFQPSESGGHFIKEIISRNQIMALAKEIERLELITQDLPYENIPF